MPTRAESCGSSPFYHHGLYYTLPSLPPTRLWRLFQSLRIWRHVSGDAWAQRRFLFCFPGGVTPTLDGARGLWGEPRGRPDVQPTGNEGEWILKPLSVQFSQDRGAFSLVMLCPHRTPGALSVFSTLSFSSSRQMAAGRRL